MGVCEATSPRDTIHVMSGGGYSPPPNILVLVVQQYTQRPKFIQGFKMTKKSFKILIKEKSD